MKRSSQKMNLYETKKKITQILLKPESTQPQPEIFFSSEDDELPEEHQNKIEKCSAIMPTSLKNQEFEQSSESEKSDEWLQQEESCSPFLLVKQEKIEAQAPIFQAEEFKNVSEVDFQLYTTFMAKSKIYGSVLVDSFGKILWCDKLAHQLLEGSLNNFTKNPIQSLLLNSMLPDYMEQLRNIDYFDNKTIVHWIIYSKNIKRRYKSSPITQNPSLQEIFYRFLKALTVRIRPIAICLPNYRDKNGFTNQDLIPTSNPSNCFFLELRWRKSNPDLPNLNIANDFIIRKYIQSHRFHHHYIVEEKEKSERNKIEGVNLKDEKDEEEISEEGTLPKLKQNSRRRKRVKTLVVLKESMERKGKKKKILKK